MIPQEHVENNITDKTQALNYELILTKLHRVTKFNQRSWLK